MKLRRSRLKSWRNRRTRDFATFQWRRKTSCAHAGGPRLVRGINDNSHEKSSKLHPRQQRDIRRQRRSRKLKNCRKLFKYSLNNRYRNGSILNLFVTPNIQTAEEILPTFRHHVEIYDTNFQKTANIRLEAIELTHPPRPTRTPFEPLSKHPEARAV